MKFGLRKSLLCTFILLAGILAETEKSNAMPVLHFAPGELLLTPGQRAGSDHLFIIMQRDANLVVYMDQKPVWQSSTTALCQNCYAAFQVDGNLVVYNNQRPVFVQAWYGASGMVVMDRAPVVAPVFFTNWPVVNGINNNVKTATLSGNPLTAVGFNEQFIMGYGRSQGYNCPLWNGTNVTQCDNSPVLSLHSVQSYLNALVSQGIKVHRDIVPIKYSSDPNHLQHIIAVMKEYQKRRMTLVFVPGFPMPGPAARNGLICAPVDDKQFEELAYQISNHTVGLFKRLRESNQLDSHWLSNHVIIEPLNEFDGIPGVKPDGTCDLERHIYGTPQKAKTLQAVMAYSFWANGFANEITAPSLVNVFGGQLSEPPASKYDTMRIFLKDYYALGGQGRPNIHLYYGQVTNPSLSANEFVNDMANGLAHLNRSIPAHYANRLLIGEVGMPEQSAHCQKAGIPNHTRIGLHQALVQNPVLNSHSEIFLFWRLSKVNPVAASGHVLGDCESSWGIVTPGTLSSGLSSWNDFDNVGRGLFEALQFRKTSH